MNKRFYIGLCLILSLVLCLSACGYDKAPVKSLGKYDSCQRYDDGGFQDISLYAIYKFSSAQLENNRYFIPVSSSSIVEIEEYLFQYERFLNLDFPQNKLEKKYKEFDHSIIDCEDYYYIYDKMGEPIGESFYDKFDNFDIYFFDYQTMTLYFFHSDV